jgi:hypothetical protein
MLELRSLACRKLFHIGSNGLIIEPFPSIGTKAYKRPITVIGLFPTLTAAVIRRHDLSPCSGCRDFGKISRNLRLWIILRSLFRLLTARRVDSDFRTLAKRSSIGVSFGRLFQDLEGGR